MTNGIFKAPEALSLGYARAAVTMSTLSETVFEWSVKLCCRHTFRVGIASRLLPEPKEIFENDENAILYSTFFGGISVGSNIRSVIR